MGVGACQAASDGAEFLSLALRRGGHYDYATATRVVSARWECSEDCAGCAFAVDQDTEVGACTEYRSQLR